jgi:hypothetical protein
MCPAIFHCALEPVINTTIVPAALASAMGITEYAYAAAEMPSGRSSATVIGTSLQAGEQAGAALASCAQDGGLAQGRLCET